MTTDFVLTTCPYCGCGCNFYLHVSEGVITDILPCKTHEISEGKLCIKGWTAHEFINHKNRLTKPLMKENHEFVEVDWVVLSYVASKFAEIIETYGPDAICIISSAKCTNEENYLLMKFARSVIGTNNIDHCARLCHASTVIGLVNSFGSGAMTNSIPEFENADCILVTGSNTIEQHPIIGGRIIRAKEKGATLIVIDPREVGLAKFADVYLRLIPGTDAALLNGMMNIIITKNLHDKEFIDTRCENFEEFRKVIELYTPEKVMEITGVNKDDLIEASELYARSKKSMVVYSMGITQHTTGTDNVMAIANLSMLTGNIGRESTGVNPLRGQNNVQGACDMGALPHVYTGYQSITNKDIRTKFENVWHTELPDKIGLTMMEMMNAIDKGKVKAMYIVGENPVLSDPNVTHTKKVLEKLEFLVVQDIFHTETTKFADVVLPACSFAEKDGTFTSTDRMIQRVRKAIEPIGESKPDWLIICELAKRMDNKFFDYTSPGQIMDEIASVTPIYRGVSYERLDNGEILRWPCLDRTHPGTKYLHKNKFTRGKGKFYPIDYRPPAELPDKDYPFILTTGRTIFHYHTGTMTRKTKLLAEEVSTGFVEINPQDARNLGIKDGDIVIVKSRRGEIEISATVTSRIRQGVVFIPFHFAECAANVLTSTALDAKAKIPELKVCAVSIYKKFIFE